MDSPHFSVIVFPTHVGVYLRGRSPNMPVDRFPHTRGGVPFKTTWLVRKESVFPTHVGVYRICFLTYRTPKRFPHTRGGVPNTSLHLAIPLMRFPHTRGGVPECHLFRYEDGRFSPHTWGCTVFFAASARLCHVFPTHVGVYLIELFSGKYGNRFSPHTWGCTAILGQ